MALQTVGKVANIFLLVFLGNLTLVMAGVTGPGRQRSGVTVAASIGVLVVYGENVRAIVSGGLPGAGGVASSAV